MELQLKKYTIVLSATDIIDITIFKKGNNLKKFALNYRSLINETWIVVYRVDNYHSFLHEQRFWRGKEPIRIQDERPLDVIITEYVLMIKTEFRRMRMYMK